MRIELFRESKKIVYLCFFLPIILTAQVNESDTLNIKAKLTLSGLWQSGNVQTVIFRAKSDLCIRPNDKLVFKTQNSYVYQEFGKVKADEDFLSLNFLYLDTDKKVYPQVLSFISTNFRREINLRFLFGGGVTVQILNQKNNWLKLSLTSEYERTHFSESDFNISEYDGFRSINTLRGTIWINGKYQLLDKKIIITHESYFQPSLERFNNYRWQADLGLELPIWKFLNFNISYRHTFESVVVEDQQQGDSLLTFGFTIKSY